MALRSGDAKVVSPCTRLDYAVELGWTRAVEILSKWFADATRTRVDEDSGCWTSDVCLNEGGYVSIRTHSVRTRKDGRRRNRAMNFVLHRVAFLAWTGRDVESGAVASHLCGRRNCFRPDHIVEESQSTNLSRCRAPCFGVVACRRHKAVLAKSCCHVPRCKRVLFVDSACCSRR